MLLVSSLRSSKSSFSVSNHFSFHIVFTIPNVSQINCQFLFLLPAKPDEPKGPIRFDEIDATTVTCSWDPPVRDGGAPISGYVVEQRDAHRPGWMPVCDSVSRPTFKFENMIEGDEYVFRAAAVNRYGTGEFLQSDIVTCRSLKSTICFFFLLDIQPI